MPPRTASWKWHHWWSVTQLRTDRSLYYPGYQKTVSRPPPPPLYLLVHNLSSHPNFPPYISNKKFLSLQLNSFVCSQWEILIESLQNFQSSVFEPLQTAAHFSDEKFIEPSCRLEVQLNRKREIEAAGWIVSTATAILQCPGGKCYFIKVITWPPGKNWIYDHNDNNQTIKQCCGWALNVGMNIKWVERRE